MNSRSAAVAALAALLAAAAPILFFSACGRQRPAVAAKSADSLTWSSAERKPRLFVAGRQGLEAFGVPAADKPAAQGASTLDLPRVAAVAARGGDGSGEDASGAPAPGTALCAIALENWGVAFIEGGKDGKSFHINQRRIDALAGLEVGGLWAADSGWILPTFRNPFADSDEVVAASPGGIHFISNEVSTTIALPPLAGLDAGYQPFAFLPDPRKEGAWLAQFRNSSGSKVTSLWASYPALALGARTAKPTDIGKSISRETFESALSPRSLSSAPEALLHALAALDEAKGDSALLRIDGASGTSLWYRWGSDPATSRELHGWIDSAGDILLLSPEGRAALLGAAAPDTGAGSPARGFALAPLPQGASFTGCALFEGGGGSKDEKGIEGLSNLWIVASWESAEATGILVGPALQ